MGLNLQRSIIRTQLVLEELPAALPIRRSEVIVPPANRLINLVSTHYPSFAKTQSLPSHVRQAVRMITMCHTSALGGHVERCQHGHISRIFYNS